MRHKGSTNEFTHQRDRHIFATFRHIMATNNGLSVMQVYQLVAASPAPRFFVSDKRAATVVSHIRRGLPLHRMSPHRRRMFLDIAQRVQQLLQQGRCPSVRKAVAMVVASPAPELYLPPSTVYEIIKRKKIECFQERKRKLRFM